MPVRAPQPNPFSNVPKPLASTDPIATRDAVIEALSRAGLNPVQRNGAYYRIVDSLRNHFPGLFGETIAPAKWVDEKPVRNPDLIQEAQEALRQWKKDGSLGDLNGFILRMGYWSRDSSRPYMTEVQFQQQQRRWNDFLDHLISEPIAPRDLAEAKELLEPARSRIVQSLPGYHPNQANFSLFLETGRGNCEARALAMCATFAKVHSLRTTLALELFRTKNPNEGHVQAVFHDSNTCETWDLWSNILHPANKGDLWHAATIYYAYLMGVKAESPVIEEELRVLRAKDPYPSEKDKPKKYSTNSILQFPRSDSFYPTSLNINIGKYLPLSWWSTPREISGPEAPRVGTGLFSRWTAVKWILAADLVMGGAMIYSKSIELDPFSACREGGWVFKWGSRRWGPFNVQKVNLPRCDKQAINSFQQLVMYPEFRKLKEIFDDPFRRFLTASSSELEQAHEAEKVFRSYRNTHRNAYIILLKDQFSYDKYDQHFKDAILSEFSEAKEFDSHQDAVRKFIEKNPKHAILMLSQPRLSLVQKRIIYENIKGNLWGYLLVSSLVNFSEDAAEWTPYHPPRPGPSDRSSIGASSKV